MSGSGIYGFALRIQRYVVRFQALLIGLCVLVIVVCTALGIYFRLARISVPWTNEVAQICLIWTMFLAATLGIYYNEHVGMPVLVDRLPRRARLLTLCAGQLCVLAFCGYMVLTGTWYVSFAQRMGGGTISLPVEIPSYVIAMVLPVSFAAGTLHAVMAFFKLEERTRAVSEVENEHPTS